MHLSYFTGSEGNSRFTIEYLPYEDALFPSPEVKAIHSESLIDKELAKQVQELYRQEYVISRLRVELYAKMKENFVKNYASYNLASALKVMEDEQPELFV